jgi:hypothetical protein
VAGSSLSEAEAGELERLLRAVADRHRLRILNMLVRAGGAAIYVCEEPGGLRRMSVPGMKHAFAAEPGIEPAPQTTEAQQVDAAATEWFRRWLT